MYIRIYYIICSIQVCLICICVCLAQAHKAIWVKASQYEMNITKKKSNDIRIKKNYSYEMYVLNNK